MWSFVTYCFHHAKSFWGILCKAPLSELISIRSNECHWEQTWIGDRVRWPGFTFTLAKGGLGMGIYPFISPANENENTISLVFYIQSQCLQIFVDTVPTTIYRLRWVPLHPFIIQQLAGGLANFESTPHCLHLLPTSYLTLNHLKLTQMRLLISCQALLHHIHSCHRYHPYSEAILFTIIRSAPSMASKAWDLTSTLTTSIAKAQDYKLID